MSSIGELERLWLELRDGATGHAYGGALESTGRIDDAANVYQAMIDDGYLIGYVDLAWVEHERGENTKAHQLLATYLEIDDEPDEQTDQAAGILGHWLWCDSDDFEAEAFLRRGADFYESARADLAKLLRASDRTEEAESVLRVGIERGEVESFLPLANLLEESGQVDEAIQLLRQGYALGDAYSAYNLYLILDSQGHETEGRDWLWKAAQGGDEQAVAFLALIDTPENE